MRKNERLTSFQPFQPSFSHRVGHPREALKRPAVHCPAVLTVGYLITPTLSPVLLAHIEHKAHMVLGFCPAFPSSLAFLGVGSSCASLSSETASHQPETMLSGSHILFLFYFLLFILLSHHI